MADGNSIVPPVEEQMKPAGQVTGTTHAASEAPVATSTTKSEKEVPTAIADTPAATETVPTEVKGEDVPKSAGDVSQNDAAVPAATAAGTEVKDLEPATKQSEPSATAAAESTEAKETIRDVVPQETSAAKPIQQLYEAFKSQNHPEIYGVTLEDPEGHVPSQIIFQKYLNANDGDFLKAKDQLLKTLEWRATMKPLELVKKTFSKAKFEGLGYVTEYGEKNPADPEKRAVFTWNVYGAAADRMNETFGNLDEFIEWRVALAELSLARLAISSATRPITADWDPYKVYQVHDYLSVSFLRRTAEVKASSTKTVAVFNQNYPETLREKFFVNIPGIMGFMYAFFKLFVAAKTLQKFHPMSNGATLANEFGESQVDGLGQKLPAAYGGKGVELKGNAEETLLG